MEVVLVISAFLIGLILVRIAIPPILKVARARHLYEPSNNRTVHKETVPPLGGIANFIVFTLSAIVAIDGYSFEALKFIIAAVILIFFVGLKDDLLALSPGKKLIVQLTASVLLITFGDIRFTSLHGILGIYEIHSIASYALSAFAIVVIMNAFNLIDGIDGLASGIAVFSGLLLGTWFFFAGQIQFAVLSYALAGSQAGFFGFNVFGKKNKLFMGDSGSLVTGLILAILAIQFNEFNLANTTQVAISDAPSVSFAILIVPLIDTLRVMSLRLMQKKSPFLPDNQHIHHKAIALVGNHLTATLLIIAGNVLVVALAILLNSFTININFQFLIVFLTGLVLAMVPDFILKARNNRKINKQELAEQSVKI